MMLESMCVPIPSELILPLAGLWAHQGKFGDGPVGFCTALFAVTCGCLAGSSIAYAIGFYGGKPLVERFGRYIFLTAHRLHTAENWIDRFGPGAIFLARLMFAVRALISFPVGILQMGYRRFILFTLLGAGIWNTIGIALGYVYGEKVQQILRKMSLGVFAVVAIVVLAAGALYFRKTHMGPQVTDVA
jgi:membrane protein DedA with SNARE-associated domain